MKALFLLGRMLFGGFFIYNGVNHFQKHEAIARHAGSKGVPAPHVAVSGTGVMMLVGGTSILLGFQPRIGAGLVLTFLLGVSPNIHDFWRIDDPNRRMSEMVNFTKNMALVGAALMIMSRPAPWPASVDNLLPQHEAPEAGRRAA